LYTAGVINEIGSVDAGNTQTDSLALERQRGITIKSAVASFDVSDVTVNLLDTPGHPDFIAEVERVLSVLDGVVLVISAVEGVQAQTRVLMRVLQRLRIPTILFVNKIDRRGARHESLIEDITKKLTAQTTVMGVPNDLGTYDASFEQYDVDMTRLALQTRQALEYPVFFGSAITGAGIDALVAGITRLLPAAEGDTHSVVSGSIFKIERGPAGEKIAYVRMFSGTIRVRDRIQYGAAEGKLTRVGRFSRGSIVQSSSLTAGQIGKLWGLGESKIGDTIGDGAVNVVQHHFAPPTLETVITPRQAKDTAGLRAALDQLAEQDPLINVRQDDVRQEIFLSLYGEVQKEVIQDVLERDYGISVDFRESSTICVERPVGSGEAIEAGAESGTFLATVGLRVAPAPVGAGNQYHLSAQVLGTMPPAFFKAIEDTVHGTLQQGLFGWSVTDCIVTLTHTGYFPRQSHSHARFDKSMSSTGADFRGLTPLVLMNALQKAQTKVCEPVYRFELEAPVDSLNKLLPVMAHHAAIPLTTSLQHSSYMLTGDIPAARLHGLQQELPALTSGQGVLTYAFDRYEPVRGQAPTRPRTDNNPLDRKEYLLRVKHGALL
jgi:ribosomal protection tetracycline resistance protein